MRIVSLWRFPVKSMQGERVPEIEVGSHGLAGDRAAAVIDEQTGHALSAKKEPRLLLLDPRGQTDESLSETLGYPLRLVTARPETNGTYDIALDPFNETEWVSWSGPEGSFHDSTKFNASLISTASLRDWDVRRFRMNIVVDGRDEADLVGKHVSIGTARFFVAKPVDRCVMVTREQPGVRRDLDVLRTINGKFGGNLGIGLLVEHPGTITVGDALHVVGT
jgi:uncharacterized protein YcbX